MTQRKRNHGFMPRRTFLKLAATTTGGLVLSGSAIAQTPMAPQRGGKVRFANEREASGSFDPALITGASLFYNHWLYEGLLDVDEPYTNLVPRLAVSWEPEQGGKAWVFKLRRGVMFHHGREFVAADVEHTFQRILNPAFGSPARALFKGIEKLEKPDTHSVRFTLADRNADFPAQLAGWWSKIVPHDRTNEQIAAEPRGTGPFKMDKYVNADRMTFRRNENYWAQGLPYLDEVEYLHIPEATTLANALKAGNIEIYYLLRGPTVQLLKRAPGISLSFTPPLRKHEIIMKLDMPPFNDDRVRRAFKLIGDRAVMTQVAHPDVPARPDDDNAVIPTSQFRIDTKIWKQDLAEAKRLLAEAGHGSGLNLTLWVISDEPGFTEFCLVFADWAKKIGVTIKMEGITSSKWYADQWLKVPFGTAAWAPRPTVDEQLRVAYTSDAKWNDTHYRNPEFDRIVDEALRETNLQKRKELYAEIQRKLVTEGGQIIPYHLPLVSAQRDSVQNFVIHPLNGMDPRKVWLKRA